MLLVGCETVPVEEPAPIVEAPLEQPVEPEQPEVVTQGLEQEESITIENIESDDPWVLISQAAQVNPGLAVELRLKAIQKFLEIEDLLNAEGQVIELEQAYLPQDQANKLQFLKAHIAIGNRNYPLAVEFLRPLSAEPTLTIEEKIEVLQLLADIQLTQDQHIDAIVNFLALDNLLTDQPKADNQLLILGLVQSLSQLEQAIMVQTASNNGIDAGVANGWAHLGQIVQLPAPSQQGELQLWRSNFPGHPAIVELVGSASELPLQRYNHVALLLPLNSRYGTAAQAFYDGFLDAHYKDLDPYKPSISLHDVGEDPSVIPFYYQGAVSEGADFIVGPLGREAVHTLLRNAPPSIPTLVLGDVSELNTGSHIFGISLSPEQEAAQVAERAFADGHRHAAVFRSDSSWGNRTASAFSARWEELGGMIVTNKSFPTTTDDYSRVIQKLLEVNLSVARERVLSAKLGTSLQFTPRRRDDSDFLFLAANTKQSRLLVPQLRYFQAHNLPIYSTSSIFSGAINPAVDADLDGLIFGDIPWMLDIQYGVPEQAIELDQPIDNSNESAIDIVENSEETINTPSNEELQDGNLLDGNSALLTIKPKPKPVAKSPYSFGALDRLYALGLESYALIPRLAALRQDAWRRYDGPAFAASVDPDGNTKRHLDWATFKDGNIVKLDSLLPKTNTQAEN